MEGWVQKRAACSDLEVFVQLRMGVETDVKERLALKKPDEQLGFKQFQQEETSFSILRERPDASRSVQFSLSESGKVTVRYGDGGAIIEGTIAFDDEFRCGLKVMGILLTCAQFRRRALEELFFGKS